MTDNSKIASFGLGLIGLVLSVLFVVSVMLFGNTGKKTLNKVSYHQLPTRAYVQFEEFQVAKDQTRFGE